VRVLVRLGEKKGKEGVGTRGEDSILKRSARERKGGLFIIRLAGVKVKNQTLWDFGSKGANRPRKGRGSPATQERKCKGSIGEKESLQREKIGGEIRIAVEKRQKTS